MNTVLLQLQKPNNTIAELESLDVMESSLVIEISDRDLHNDTETWSLPMIVAYFVSLLGEQNNSDSEDSFRDLQSMIE